MVNFTSGLHLFLMIFINSIFGDGVVMPKLLRSGKVKRKVNI